MKFKSQNLLLAGGLCLLSALSLLTYGMPEDDTDPLAPFIESVDEMLEAWNIPAGQLAIFKNGEPYRMHAYKNTEVYEALGLNDTIDNSSLFRLASLSKAITAMGVLKLRQDGLDEHASIVEFLREKEAQAGLTAEESILPQRLENSNCHFPFECNTDNDCGEGEECFQNDCLALTQDCSNHSECTETQLCDRGFCRHCENARQCNTAHEVDNGYACNQGICEQTTTCENHGACVNQPSDEEQTGQACADGYCVECHNWQECNAVGYEHRDCIDNQCVDSPGCTNDHDLACRGAQVCLAYNNGAAKHCRTESTYEAPPGNIAQITTHQLLHHTAGWDRQQSGDPAHFTRQVWLAHPKACIDGNGLNADYGYPQTYSDYPPPVAMTRRIKEWLRTPLDFEPGTDGNSYSNIGYEVLGEIIRRSICSEEEECPTYSDFIGDLLADQGISSNRMRTGKAPKYEQGDNEASHIDYYNIYHNIAYDDEACRVSSSFPEVPNQGSLEYNFPLVAAPDGGNTIIRDRANSNAGLQSSEIGGNAASGGWLGTADDYARFISCMANDSANNGLLVPCGTTLYENVQPQPPEFFAQKPSYMDADDNSGYYGSGVGISQSTGNWTHSGAWHGASSQFIRVPEDNNGDVLTVVLLANTRPLFSSYGCTASSDRSEPVQRQIVLEKPFTPSQKSPSGHRPGDDDNQDNIEFARNKY